MTVGLDNHVWGQTWVPRADPDFFELLEIAGPRAEGRSVFVENRSDVSVVVTLYAMTSEASVEPIPFFTFKLDRGDKVPQAAIANGHGFTQSLDTKARLVGGTTTPLAGSLAGIQVYVESDEDATNGAVYTEICCRYDS